MYSSNLGNSSDLPPGFKSLSRIKGTGVFTRIEWSPDGRTLALPSRDGTVQMVDLDTLDASSTVLRGHSGAAICCAFHPNGSELAVGSYGNFSNIQIFERDTLCRWSLLGHAGQTSTIAFAPANGGGILVSGSHEDNTIKWWDIQKNGALLNSVDSPGVSCLAFSDAGQFLAASSLDGCLRVYTAEGKHSKTLIGHSAASLMVKWIDHNRLVSCGKDGTIKIWDVETGEALHVLAGHTHSDVLSVDYCAPFLVSKARDHTVILWHSNEKIAQLKARSTFCGWNVAARFHPLWPRVPLLAAVSAEDKAVDIFEIDLALFWNSNDYRRD